MQLTKNVYEVVANELRQNIQSGLLKPSERLATIEQLAKQYQVGRSTIREALSLLRAEGLIHSIQGGGTYVNENPVTSLQRASAQWLGSPQELRDLVQVRKILEVGVISVAAENRTSDDVKLLSNIIEQMKRSIGNEEASQLYDVNFHLAIAHATHNKLLADMMEHLSAAMTKTIHDSRKLWLYGEMGAGPHLFREHEKMFYAIREKNVRDAVAIMNQHLERVENALGIMGNRAHT